MKKNKIIYTIVAIVSIVLVAGLGSVFVNLGMQWFNGLSKPSQWIPNYVIPIVWSIIYVLFAITLSLWINHGKIPKDTLVLLIANGVFNILWCLVFFTLHLTFLGNVVIVINLLLGLALLFTIFKYNSFYGYLTMIYPIWLFIATTLNTALWILN